jgi:hypothetical protein
VHRPVRSPHPAPPTGSPSPPQPSAGTVLTLVNGVLAGIGGTYATTHSITITVIAGIMAIVLALMVLIFYR